MCCGAVRRKRCCGYGNNRVVFDTFYFFGSRENGPHGTRTAGNYENHCSDAGDGWTCHNRIVYDTNLPPGMALSQGRNCAKKRYRKCAVKSIHLCVGMRNPRLYVQLRIMTEYVRILACIALKVAAGFINSIWKFYPPPGNSLPHYLSTFKTF